MAAERQQRQQQLTQTNAEASRPSGSHDYKGFVAGVFSGMAKLAVGHPFDTVKVRLQTSDRFKGAVDCAMQTVRREGVRGLYKGASPPLVGWMVMDSVLMGSLNVYRRLVADKVYGVDRSALPTAGHGVAGVMAGATVSMVAAPVEHVKARLQIQYAAAKADRLYSGPVDCVGRIVRHHGLAGLYHGLTATLIFRSFFFFWWTSYDLLSGLMRRRSGMGDPAINFWAGGLSAQLFWVVAYPADVVKQRVMTDPLGGGLGDGTPRYPSWRAAAVSLYREGGTRAYFRGFMPCFLRAFPTNASALLVWELVMRGIA
ncbi:solute carrier family 25 (mitochondrial carnitine/acylcarnitine transporter), member 20/29 [Geosmithia morbida]|uniref:Solute carrier family 25 (Mitochondrial carnitine/acylcarnitine transporter), member 20/29 n=1 Tax=Geosmithia morbida TaxID=1094350 RepID=A0A9P5D577_9HYPO|nr:solute carrier family 25 (mitochondrial carnitine/acylcarnitine transporter), member 20/29 [Geosmithia morbida]KAF4124276.1 solute carrier family 25 (mitochondrial carnitine/acylcarnitine transporter), member 20/29 [Geosmithia morbida]